MGYMSIGSVAISTGVGYLINVSYLPIRFTPFAVKLDATGWQTTSTATLVTTIVHINVFGRGFSVRHPFVGCLTTRATVSGTRCRVFALITLPELKYGFRT